MPNTLTRPITYPAGGAAPNVPLVMQTMAESVQTQLLKIKAGSGTISIGAGVASTTLAVTFPEGGFSAPPVVTVTNTANVAGRASLLNLYVNGITATGFTLKMQTSDNANIGTSFSIGFNYVAVLQ